MKKKSSCWFTITLLGVFSFFSLIMVYVAHISFSRQSGVTKLDVAKIQKLRYDANINRTSE